MKNLYFLFLLCSFIGFSQNPGDLVITEFLNDSDAVSDTDGEWFEIYNTTNSDINIDSWVIRDDESNSYTFTGTLMVPANSYFVLGRGVNDPAVNGGVNLDFSYGNGVFTLGNGGDEIVLETPNMVEIDRVNYGSDNGFPDEGAGVSIILNPTLTIGTVDNSDGANWCFSSTAFGDGDLGTPGAANDTCTDTCLTDLGADDTACNGTNPGADDDTYDVTLNYSGAATGETFVVSTMPSGFTIGGDNPTNVADGTITVSGVTEGTDITITVENTGDGGLCDLSRDITSPVCVPTGAVGLELKGVIDFTVVEGGSSGKAVHLVATADIPDLSEYSVAVASNGGGSYGDSFSFPNIAVSSGEHILLARDLVAMENYLTPNGYNLFDYQIEATSSVTQNGDDTIGLFKNENEIEAFGDINVDGSGEDWEYLDSWGYKDTAGAVWPMGWIYGAVDCTDDSATTFDSTCVYPFVESLSNAEFTVGELNIYPNPVNNGLLTITSKIEGMKNIALFDLTGRNVMTTNINATTLDVSDISSGIYLLRVTISNRTSTTKLIIN